MSSGQKSKNDEIVHMTTTRKTFYSEIYNSDDIPAKHRPCLVGLGQKFPAEEIICLVATVLKLDLRDGAICNQIYEKVVCI